MTDLYDLATGIGIVLAVGIMFARGIRDMAGRSAQHPPSDTWSERKGWS